MKVLVIHHLEPTWAEAYKRVGGVTFDKLCRKVAKHIRKSSYDRVILTQFEFTPLHNHGEYEPILDKINEQHEYGYGWELGCFDFEPSEHGEIMTKLEAGSVVMTPHGSKIALGGYHSQVVLVDDWMFDLVGHNVSICGAFDGECVEDLEIALSAAKVEYKRVNSLII